MKKKIMLFLVAAAMVLSALVGLVACNNTKGATSRDVYAMSAVSSIEYLTEGASTRARKAAAPATARPDYVLTGDVAGIRSCIDMFDGIIAGGGIDQTIKNNTSTDERFSAYNFVMTITTPDLVGKTTYTMYFDEISKQTNEEIDDGQKEIEESTRFEGVVVVNDDIFVVKGEREVETEGNEVETSIEFVTYKNIEGTTQADLSNFVKVEQSTENNEVEYEYTFYKDGRMVQDIELEYEQGRRGAEVTFEIKQIEAGEKSQVEYSVKKGNGSNVFYVEFERNGKENRIVITKLENGAYKFAYSNGFEETVN